MKNIADGVLLPIGFYFIESRNDVHMYAHERAPVFAHAFLGGGKNRCNLSYQMSDGLFSEMVTKTLLDRDLIIQQLSGFKETLIKLGIEK